MKNVFATSLLLVSILGASGVAADSGDSLAIPLSGILPVQCSVRAHSVTIDDTPDPTTITILVEHRCNARNNLVVRVRPGEGPAEVQFNSTYNQRTPSAKSEDREFFFQSGPVEQVREVKVRFPNFDRRNADQLIERLQITVESF